MAITPKKPAPKAAPAPAAESGITNVTVGRSFTIPGEGEYESQKVSVIVSAPTYEEASAAVGEFMTTEFEKSSEQFAQFREASDSVAEEIANGDNDGEEEGGEEASEGEGAEEGVDADAVRAMSRKELEALNTENSIGIEPTKFAKTKKGTSDFAEAIIEAAGLEAEEGSEEAGEEEAGEEGEAEGEEEGALTYDDVMAMERSELLALNTEHTLGLKTKGKELDEVRAMVAEALGLEGGEEEAGEEGEEEAPAEEDATGYTRQELEAMNPTELKAIWTEWGIKDKFPTGAVPIIKKKATVRIIQYQETGE